jgi:hypothetical protein
MEPAAFRTTHQPGMPSNNQKHLGSCQRSSRRVQTRLPVPLQVVVNPAKDSVQLTGSGPATYIATGRPVRVSVCNAPSQHTQTLVGTLLLSISAAS